MFIPVFGVKWGRAFLWLNKPILWIAQKFWHKISKNEQIDSGPVPGCTSTRNSPQEITKSEDTSPPDSGELRQPEILPNKSVNQKTPLL